jgi:glutamyl-tRNA synthetase
VVTGRLAPSPTGSLHVGNARTFLWAWLSARAQGGRVLLRIEDLDQPRVKPGVREKLVDDLRWLGFDWDGDVEVQSDRCGHYARVYASLRDHVYACACTRADVAAAQSAPNEGDAEPRYPGTCRDRAVANPVAWRLRVPPGAVAFDDVVAGPQSIDVAATVGDFVVAKSASWPAYQLAVVADDVAQGVTEVVRGDDLIPSTARQILIYRLLGAGLPRYAHVPLVVGPDGKRLAKRHGDARIASLRDAGVTADRVIAALARWSNLPALGTPRELVAHWDWLRVPRARVVLTQELLRQLRP